MCLAVPGKVVSTTKGQAIVDIGGQRKIVIAKDIHVLPEDYVLIQFGVIVEKMSKEDAEEAITIMKNSREQ